MKTPCGVELKNGQQWQERDNRRSRIVVIQGWNEETQKVNLIYGNRKTVASLKRFSGKSGGYVFVSEAA